MIYICGCVLNCGVFLEKVFNNIKKVGEIFTDYKIIISYDDSIDNSLSILHEYQKYLPLVILHNTRPRSCIRTKNISEARNLILDYIYNKDNKDGYKYFIMLDMDDVNSTSINTDILKYYLYFNNESWDALSFNRRKYYDIWALSIEPFILSCWHWTEYWADSNYIVLNINFHVVNLLSRLNNEELLECYSAFNGLSLYKIEKFVNCRYEWNINKNIDLINSLNSNFIDLNKKTLEKNNMIIDTSEYINESEFIKYNDPLITIKKIEDCEHRHFHLSAIKYNNARIRISPMKIFS